MATLLLPIILVAVVYVADRICRWRRLRAQAAAAVALRQQKSFFPPQPDDGLF